MDLIRLEGIDKTYHLGEIDVPVLKDISLSIQQGELVALMGASGSGKTTLMNILGCLDRPSAGRYWFQGEEVSELSVDERARLRSRKIGFVFQSFNLLPRTTATEQVVMPLEYAAAKPTDEEGRSHVAALLERVGLGNRASHVPAQMSGGQQQRVAIARALVNDPILLLADEPTGNLDSRTSAEILGMFQELNREGLTILLVTHDAEVAAHAKRVIRIRDGQIEDDRVIVPKETTPPSTALVAGRPPAAPPPAAAQPAPAAPRRSAGSLLPPTLKGAITALRRNAMRSALTTLGIVIGVAAVITMMEIGEGSKRAVQESIASMGANNLLVLPGAASSGGVTFGAGSVPTLTPQDAEEIARQVPGVEHVAPIVRARTQIVYGNRNWVPVFIYGTTPSFLQIRDWTELQEGAPFTERGVRNGSKVCLVGQTIVRELFNGRSPIGKEIRIQNVAFRVIGVLRRKGANMMGMDQDDIVLAPWTTIKYRVSGTTLTTGTQTGPTSLEAAQRVNSLSQLYPGSTPLLPQPSATQQADTPQPVRFTNVDQILVKARTAAAIPVCMRQITELLRERHHIHPGETDDFNIRDMTEMTKALSSTSQLMSTLLLAVALISLVVGGVGIMNIMLVSVTERTREIGLRMAVGARPGLILRQFLIEAIVLCLLGGAVGIAVGWGCSFLVRRLLHWPTETSLLAVAAAVIVSATVGILFGFYPAWKGSRLDPIDALRYE